MLHVCYMCVTCMLHVCYMCYMCVTCSVAYLQGAERGKAFSLLLHMADISHPGKPWPLHLQWSHRIAEEYYKQGDQERKQGLPLSPLCDRDTGNLATSQIGNL